MRTIVNNLNFAVNYEMGQTEQEVIHGVLTDPGDMSRALVNLPHEAVLSLYHAVENNDRYYKMKNDNEALFHFGVAGRFNNHGFIFPEVFRTLKKSV